MKRLLMPATALAAMKKLTLTILCSVVLMIVVAPARADICTSAVPPAPAPCDVTILITGSTGHLSAVVSDLGTFYPTGAGDDKLIGIQNNSSSVYVGAIILSAPNAAGEQLFDFGDNDGACGATCGPTGYEGPNNTFVGISPDLTTGKILFKTPLASNGGTTWFSLETAPTNVVAIGENQTLVAGQPSVFPFGPFGLVGGTFTENANNGPDAFQIKPLNSASGDKLTVTPVPVPAGPLGLNNWGSGNFGAETPATPGPGPVRFSAAAPFSNLACAPFADFSQVSNPVCVEIELDCTSPEGGDSCNFLYTTQLDYAVDPNSLPSPIGGIAFLVQHDVSCPAGFTQGDNPTQNIFLSYTGSVAGSDPPLKGGGTGGHSCYASAFDPTAPPVAVGTTFSSFVGFLSPVSDTDLNLVKAGQVVPLKWQLFKSPGVPLVENLHLCGSSLGIGCTAPWVFVGTLKTACMGDTTPNADILDDTVPAGSAIQSSGNGTYQYNLNTKKGSTGCFNVVLKFDTGLTVYPANFQYK